MLEDRITALTISESMDSDYDAQMMVRITTPRTGKLSEEEIKYLSERPAPVELHPRLRARLGAHIFPPVFYRGWIINEQEIWPKVAERGMVEFFSAGHPCKYASIYRYVYSVLKEIGVRLPIKTCLSIVVGPSIEGNDTHFHLSLHNNYLIRNSPSKEDIEKVRQAFGFVGEPRWYASTRELHWKFR